MERKENKKKKRKEKHASKYLLKYREPELVPSTSTESKRLKSGPARRDPARRLLHDLIRLEEQTQ